MLRTPASATAGKKTWKLLACGLTSTGLLDSTGLPPSLVSLLKAVSRIFFLVLLQTLGKQVMKLLQELINAQIHADH